MSLQLQNGVGGVSRTYLTRTLFVIVFPQIYMGKTWGFPRLFRYGTSWKLGTGLASWTGMDYTKSIVRARCHWYGHHLGASEKCGIFTPPQTYRIRTSLLTMCPHDLSAEAQNFFTSQDLANISCLQHKKTSPKFTVS